MLTFKEVSIEDCERYRSIIFNSGYLSCEYSFATLYMWCKDYDMLLCDDDTVFMVMSRYEGEKSYLFPCGKEEDVVRVISQLIEMHRVSKEPLLFYGVEPRAAELIQKFFPNSFSFTDTRDNYDYIYASEDLQNLAGKKYHQKRNHLKKFEMLDNWSFEEINRDNIDQCIAMDDNWVKEHPKDDSEHETSGDKVPIERAFAHFEELGMQGGLLRLHGKVVAFSFGEKTNQEEFVVHIEKAYPDLPGAYPMINREMARRFGRDVKYINREDDVGVEGLRKAKLSYHPEILLEKSTITYIGE